MDEIDYPDIPFPEEMQEIREREWRDGDHTTKAGDLLRIKDMTSDHIANTIILFKGAGYDVRPLERELMRRRRQQL